MHADSIMAGRLLSVVLAAVLVHGCLIPQDDPVLPDLPLKRNTPPELRTDQATPARRGSILKLNTACPKDRPFGILVVDPDLDNTIRSRWFVDHDIKFTTVSVEGMALSGTQPERGILKPLELLYSPGGLLYTAGPHFVTVVVSDREFIPGGIDLQLTNFDLPDGGTTPDTSKTAQYTWDVITDLSANCQ